MKKIQIFVSAVFAMLCLGACQEKTMDTVSEEVAVNVSVSLPAEQTKAMSEADLVDIVYYEVWNSDMTVRLIPAAGEEPVSAPVSGKTATLSLTLVSSQTYNFIFWAQNEACGAYDVDDLQKVGVDYSVIAAAGNQDKFDAFYAVEKIAVDGPINETVTLRRPFAQLNFGADTMNTDLGAIAVGATSVKVSQLATVFNTITGHGEAEQTDVVFLADGIAANEALVVNGKSYTWIAMDYMLMMADNDVVEVEAVFNVGMDAPVKQNIGNVPLKKNYRTNIVGDLFTANARLTIVVDPDFDQPDEVVDVEK
jgi:hypothetical protein